MCEKDIILDLFVGQGQYEAWEEMSNTMCLNIYEYIRRCTDAHTNILKKDAFDLVQRKQNENKNLSLTN